MTYVPYTENSYDLSFSSDTDESTGNSVRNVPIRRSRALLNKEKLTGQTRLDASDAHGKASDRRLTNTGQLDLTSLFDDAGQIVNIHNITVGDDGFGNALLIFPDGETITLAGISPSVVTSEVVLAAMGVPVPDKPSSAVTTTNQTVTPAVDDDPVGSINNTTLRLTRSYAVTDRAVNSSAEVENIICFTPGSMILTSHGERAVETLRVGDMVVTRDQGLRPIRWIGKRTLPGDGCYAPVRVGTNALDSARSGLLVSPRHRILYTGYRAELLFGESEVLVPAKHLIDGKDVVREKVAEVTYIHLMFDHHEVIYASGIATESFHAGDMGLDAVSDQSREELFALFPELRSTPGQHLETARTCLKKREAVLLMGDIDEPHA